MNNKIIVLMLVGLFVSLSFGSLILAHGDDVGEIYEDHHSGIMRGTYGMMSGFNGGFGFMWLFGWVFMVLIVVVLILFIVWLIKQIQK